ncbi:MAG: alpha/beta hydrolase [Xanthobacteraceae bacterium]|nr:alpha/beta hydrolase [Xanthobacteraceae bacterium]
MNSATITLPSGRRWQVHTGGSGPDILWLHGLRGVDPADPTLAALQARYRVTAPVAPGFNDLEELSRIDNIHELALDYDDLIEHLGLKTFSLIGHSFGAMIAADIAAHFPKRADKLVLLAPFGLWNDAYPVADIFAMPYMQMDDILWHDPAARETFARKVVTDADVKEAAAQMVKLAGSLTAVTKFVWPIPDRGLARRLPRIACPVLVLFGADDRVVPRNYAADFKKGLQHSQTAVVPGAGHMLPYEKPQQVADLIERFLKVAPAKVA